MNMTTTATTLNQTSTSIYASVIQRAERVQEQDNRISGYELLR